MPGRLAFLQAIYKGMNPLYLFARCRYHLFHCTMGTGNKQAPKYTKINYLFVHFGDERARFFGKKRASAHSYISGPSWWAADYSSKHQPPGGASPPEAPSPDERRPAWPWRPAGRDSLKREGRPTSPTATGGGERREGKPERRRGRRGGRQGEGGEGRRRYCRQNKEQEKPAFLQSA